MKYFKDIQFRSIILLLIGILAYNNGFTQDFQMIKSYEDSIVEYSNQILEAQTDAERLELNKQLSIYAEKAIRQESSIEYKFEKLHFVSIVTSNDKKLRILSWAIKMKNDQWQYFGLTQSYVKSSKSYKYNKLIDKTAKLRHADSKTLNAKKWFGAYYYKLIETRHKGKSFYTLLGWKGFDRSKSKKVIEIATIRSNGDIVFGYPLFNIRDYAYFKNKRARRLIFTFSSQVKMFLDYDTQSIHIKKNTKKKKKSHKKQRGFRPVSKDVSSKEKIKTITKPMIVMDRLEPTNKEMTEFYEFYFPETNVVDALLFEKGKWNYFPDVDARNSLENEKNEKPKKTINYDL